MEVFSIGEMRVLEALVACLAPPVPGPAPAEAARVFAAEFAGLPRRVRWALRLLLWAMELAPCLRLRPRFTRLPRQEQEACLRRWEASRIYGRRFALLALKLAANLGFFHDARAERSLGYDPATAAPEGR